MTISLKPISLYQELEPYDVDVDNRPLLDIQDNLTQIASILESTGSYLELSADPSSEPAGLFSPFTCAAIYSNSLLIPINIAKTTADIDYSKYPIVLVLGYKEATKTYSCLSFSAGIKLSSKFASFVPGAEGRLLRVGPGGELIDQMYFDLAHASKGYQALYVGKILGPNSIVFGGNQINILGNNYYLGKNRNDMTSGLITVQRSSKESNVVFKSINVNETNSLYNFAEFVNTSASSYSLSEAPIDVYFSSSQLSYNQKEGVFTNPSLETYLNAIHFKTPSITALTGSEQINTTAGVNVRGLLDFTGTNLVHNANYSNSISELTQNLSTKLIFSDRPKLIVGETSVPMGVQLPGKTTSIGISIDSSTNLPNAIIPTSDTTGMTFGDFYGVGGAYVGAIQDNSLDPAASTRPKASDDQSANDKNNNANIITSNIITDYSDGFTLLIASTSSSAVTSNLALRTDGYLNLSSGKGILTNQKIPVLDLELASKYYIDKRVDTISSSDSQKIPITGTVSDTPVIGSLLFDVTGNNTSLTNVLNFKGVNQVDITSDTPIHFLTGPNSTTHQIIFAQTSTGDMPTSGPEIFELVNKNYLLTYVTGIMAGSTGIYVTSGTDPALAGGGEAVPQGIWGTKTFNSLTSIQTVKQEVGLRLLSGVHRTDFAFDTDGNLSVDSGIDQIVLVRETQSIDKPGALVTKGYLEDAIKTTSPFNVKSRLELASGGGLAGVDRFGYSILGNLVTFWAKTTPMPFPSSSYGTGDPWNPEQEIFLPPGLFSELFSVQAQITNDNPNRYAEDTFIQLVNFDPSNVTKIKIKFQSAGEISTPNGYAASILITGYVGSPHDISNLPDGSL